MTGAAPACVAVVHYHFRRGGVTRVVENSLAALAGDAYRFTALSGEPAPRDATLAHAVRTVPGLGYDDPDPACDADSLADRLQQAARQAFGRDPDLWHVHNHALGKNAALPGAVAVLAGRGQRLLLQVHDFAEDGRPSNYAHMTAPIDGGSGGRYSGALYPTASHVHYALINGRDRQCLLGAGLDPDRAHALPNAVHVEDSLETLATPSGGRTLYVYPTRAIRRKNLGEFLLWASLASRDARFAVTLAPRNPTARPVYETWVSLCGKLGLDVSFEYGASSGLSFINLFRSADSAVTTSVAEGFGLAFLEPWIAICPLIGRDLPDITADFRSAGVDLSSLYDRVDVPIEWIGEEVFRRELSHHLAISFGAYGRELPGDAVERAFHSAVRNGRADFGRLNEPMQQAIIERVCKEQGARSEISPDGIEDRVPAEETVAQNAEIIAREFSLSRYRSRLMRTYAAVLASETGPVSHLDDGRVLDAYLDPGRFNLLRT